MSDDGADLGVSAEDALKVVLGGEEPKGTETVDEMRDRILAQELSSDESYDACATSMARIVLQLFMQYPALAQVPTETEYLVGRDGNHVMLHGGLIPISLSLWDVIKTFYPSERSIERLVMSSLTGFQWGWAVNAARRCVELPPVSNPAILTVDMTP